MSPRNLPDIKGSTHTLPDIKTSVPLESVQEPVAEAVEPATFKPEVEITEPPKQISKTESHK